MSLPFSTMALLAIFMAILAVLLFKAIPVGPVAFAGLVLLGIFGVVAFLAN